MLVLVLMNYWFVLFWMDFILLILFNFFGPLTGKMGGLNFIKLFIDNRNSLEAQNVPVKFYN